jgi:transcriptional regulator with XRE-family HTH domain
MRIYIWGIERGTRNPSLRHLARLAAALSITLQALFKEVSCPHAGTDSETGSNSQACEVRIDAPLGEPGDRRLIAGDDAFGRLDRIGCPERCLGEHPGELHVAVELLQQRRKPLEMLHRLAPRRSP